MRLKLRILVSFFALLGLLFSGLSCDDNGGTPTVDTHPDTSLYDSAPADQYPWPDQGPDQWYPDLYSGAPFGCQSDADCFGQKCCATPWGVKLCAATCDQ